MGIHLILHYCSDSRSERRAEYDYCVRRNLANPHIERIHNLGIDDVQVPEEFRDHQKWSDHFINRRMMFADAFRYANQLLLGEMVGICNLDTFLDEHAKWDEAEGLLRSKKVFLCQSRTEFKPPESFWIDEAFARLAHANAQDAWFFIPPLSPPDTNFEIGTLGCDNAIAERVLRVGHMPINLGSRYKVMHYDLYRGKKGGNTNAVHRAEASKRGTVYSRFPEREGCYLVPDFDRIQSLDQLAADLGLSPLQKYQLICETLSRYIRICN